MYKLQSDRSAEDFVRGLHRRFRRALAALALTIFVSTLGFVALGRHDGTWRQQLFDGFWDTMNLVSTVGSLPQLTGPERAWALIVIIVGLGAVLYGFGTLQGLLHGGDVRLLYGRRKMSNTLSNLQRHVLVCGYGNVGSSVANQIRVTGAPLVVIEHDEQIAEQASEDGFLVINADATHEEALTDAGVTRAEGLVAALGHDAANVFLCLISREMNPRLRIVARAERQTTRSTLQRAGADRVIVPSEIAAVQLSHLMLKPKVTEFIAGAVGEADYEFAELPVDEHLWMKGRTLDELELSRAKTLVIAIIDADGHQIFNPPRDRPLQDEETLIVVCTQDGLSLLSAIS